GVGRGPLACAARARAPGLDAETRGPLPRPALRARSTRALGRVRAHRRRGQPRRARPPPRPADRPRRGGERLGVRASRRVAGRDPALARRARLHAPRPRRPPPQPLPVPGPQGAPQLLGLLVRVPHGPAGLAGALRGARAPGSRWALTPEQVRARMAGPNAEHARAAAYFRLGTFLHEQGRAEAAQAAFAEAKKLRPESWNFKRQTWHLEEPGKSGGPEFWA